MACIEAEDAGAAKTAVVAWPGNADVMGPDAAAALVGS